LLEGHPQMTKSTLAENEGVKIHQLVRHRWWQLRTGSGQRKCTDVPSSLVGKMRFPTNCR
jgi:hypothetical protein